MLGLRLVAPQFAVLVFALFSFSANAAYLGTYNLDSTTNTSHLITVGPYSESNGSTAPGTHCSADYPCDTLDLIVTLPPGYVGTNPNDLLQAQLGWADPGNDTIGLSVTDFDVILYDTNCASFTAANEVNDPDGNAQGATLDNPEIVITEPQDGVLSYCVQVIPYTASPLGQEGILQLSLVQLGPIGGGGGSVSLGGPQFLNYPTPTSIISGQADEPTLDVNLNTDHALMIFSLSTLRAQWDDTASPATVQWDDVSDIFGALTTADPILTGDQFPMDDGTPNSRIWTSQLLGATSYIGFTDDEGETWTESQGGGQPHGADNQSMAAGPYPAGAKPLLASYDHAVYYCSHSVVNAFCSRSDDGGLTFNFSRPIFPAAALCNNHGHVKVGIDGTVYVPMNNTCEGAQGVSISIDAGETWHYVKVPDTVRGRWDSAIGLDAIDGQTIYYGYGEEGIDEPMIIKGTLNKSNPTAPTIDWDPSGAVNVGTPAGLKNIVFPNVIVGDKDRVAYSFHGTTHEGDSGEPLDMVGAEWHLYVATTFDGGATWGLRQVSTDPVQRNAICDRGTTCANEARPADRNLLDFMDMVADSEGRLLIGYADGCTGACALPGGSPNYDNSGVIARQTSGKRMYAAFDPSGLPGGPLLTGTRHPDHIALGWFYPDDGGSAITDYYLERSTDGVTFSQIAHIPFGAPVNNRYQDDTAVDLTKTYHYRVVAENGNGLGNYGNVLAPLFAETVCAAPGLTVLTDTSEDIFELGLVPQPIDPGVIDVLRAGVSQPYSNGDYKLAFHLQMRDLSVVPPGIVWPLGFFINGGTDEFEVSMSTLTSIEPVFQLSTPTATITAEPESHYTPEGLITIVVKASDLGFSNPGDAAESLERFQSRIVLVTLTPDNMPNDVDDTARTGSFQTVAANTCLPNAAPTATLSVGAGQATGAAPHLVNFSVAAADADGDTPLRYVFETGDGTPTITQSSPTLSHSYLADGLYRAQVHVVDSRGGVSSPSALNIHVGPDLDPDGFAFDAQTSLQPDQVRESNFVRIRGIDGLAPVTVENGQFRTGRPGRWSAWSMTPDTVKSGQHVQVRHWTSSFPNHSHHTTLTVGSQTATFTTTTAAALGGIVPADSVQDTVPDRFSFVDVVDAPRNTQVASAPIILSGLSAPVPCRTHGTGQISINGGPFSLGNRVCVNGDSVQVRHTTRAGKHLTVETLLDVGGVIDAFSTKTK